MRPSHFSDNLYSGRYTRIRPQTFQEGEMHLKNGLLAELETLKF